MAVRAARWLGWRGAIVSAVALAIGIWAVVTSCNTETAACKGAESWSTLWGTLNRVGWVLMVLGVTSLVVSVVIGAARTIRARRGG